MKKIDLVSVLPLLLITSCNNKPQKEYFKLWNDCASIKLLKEFVEDVTNKDSKNFIPAEDRIATFDMDGTFIGELFPNYFEYNLLEYRALDDPNYKNKDESVIEAANAIRKYNREREKLPDHFDMVHAHAAAKAYAGMTIPEFDKYVKDYAKKEAVGFTGLTYANGFYKPMLEVFDYLKDNDFKYYVVSGSDRFICRSLVESIGIEPDRVIGMDVEYMANNQGEEEGVDYTYTLEDHLVRTENLLIKNLKTNKVKQISQEIGKVPVLSFGNSDGDCAMHNYCMQNPTYKSAAFMVVADDFDRDHTDQKRADRAIAWKENNYTIISEKNDWKTIYGEGVAKAKFPWEN